jgi:hypothetical protein
VEVGAQRRVGAFDYRVSLSADSTPVMIDTAKFKPLGGRVAAGQRAIAASGLGLGLLHGAEC